MTSSEVKKNKPALEQTVIASGSGKSVTEFMIFVGIDGTGAMLLSEADKYS